MDHQPAPTLSDALAAYFGTPSADEDHPHDCRWQTLADIAKARQHLEALEHDIGVLVRHAHRDHEVSWAELARSLGVTRQAVRQRYGTD